MPVKYALRIPLSGLLNKLRPTSLGLEPHALSEQVLALLQRVPADIRRKTRLVLSATMQDSGDSSERTYRHDLAFLTEDAQPWVPLSSATDFLKRNSEFSKLNFIDCIYQDEETLSDYPGPELMDSDGYVVIRSVPKSSFRTDSAASYSLNPQLLPGQIVPDDKMRALRAIEEQLKEGCVAF